MPAAHACGLAATRGQQAAARETASASAHAHSVESYEAELRCASAREAVQLMGAMAVEVSVKVSRFRL